MQCSADGPVGGMTWLNRSRRMLTGAGLTLCDGKYGLSKACQSISHACNGARGESLYILVHQISS